MKREQGCQVALPSRCHQPLTHPSMLPSSDFGKLSVDAHLFYVPLLTSLTFRNHHTSHPELHPWLCHRCPLPPQVTPAAFTLDPGQYQTVRLRAVSPDLMQAQAYPLKAAVQMVPQSLEPGLRLPFGVGAGPAVVCVEVR